MAKKKAIKKKKRDLTPKQTCFVSEYLLDFNATRAAKAAGYSEKTAYSMGHELLKKPEIHIFIDKRIASIIEKNDVKIAEVLRDLRDIKEKCMQATEVMEYNHATKQMERTGEWQFDSRGAIKALELIGKYLSMFTDKLDIGGNVSISINGKDAEL